MKYFSAFSGIGGFELGIHSTFPNSKCIGYSEINKYAILVYQRHFPTHKNYGDITLIDIEALPDFDLLVGGSPCQDLSIAKKNRQGLKGCRSGLFYNFVEILESKKPKYFLLENVASMPKEDKEMISSILGVEPVMINASTVSAQNRKRLFWCNWKVEQVGDRGILLKDILEENVKSDLSEGYLKWLNGESGKKRINKKFIAINPEKAITLKARDYANWGGNLILIDHYNRKIKTDGKAKTLGTTPQCETSVAGQSILCVGIIPENIKPKGNYLPRERIFSGNGKFRAISTSKNQQPYIIQTRLVNEMFIRKLTTTECARLQCFPDDWCDGISNTQQYKCYGNAVNVEVVKYIMAELQNAIQRDD